MNRSSNGSTVCKLIFPIAAALWVSFIFYNSLQNGEVSGGRSGGALEMFQNLFHWAGLPFPFSEFFLRKAAHFLEFCALGILLTISTRSYTAVWMPRIWIPLFFSLAVPVSDEWIQKFVPGRSSEVRDVVLDFSGALTGILITTLIVFLIDRARRRKVSQR